MARMKKIVAVSENVEKLEPSYSGIVNDTAAAESSLMVPQNVFYREYIMWNAGLDEAQDGIKIAGGNINNLRYVDDTTLMAESEE